MSFIASLDSPDEERFPDMMTIRGRLDVIFGIDEAKRRLRNLLALLCIGDARLPSCVSSAELAGHVGM